ncbi:VOC family protein [Nocardia lasii]|uniref:VOC family protein n=1 Tax=Nocardia lasii TaxID=1616107 RepID=A0ABW1JNM7_9NOCA
MSETITLGGVTIDSNDPTELAEFWKSALGYDELVNTDGTFIMIVPPGVGFGQGRYLAFQLVPEAKVVKNRVHLDFQTTTRATEVARLIALGATTVAEHQVPGLDWTVLADPHGNEFCVVSAHG